MDTKGVTLGVLFVFLAVLAYPAFSVTCSFYTSEGACEGNNCFWCENCANNQLGNSFGGDRCVESSLNCTYSCSMACGAQCQANTDCQGNITGNTCYFDGICNACSCIYKQDYCPKPGTLKDATDSGAVVRLCYYETRSCGTNGCSVQSCQLDEDEICDPENGCRGANGTSGEFFEDYRCNGNELLADKISYFCNATECFYEKTNALVERCENGCNNGECNEELCSIYGVSTKCSRYDGFYGDGFCIGPDIYQHYRTYSCGVNECVFSESARKIAGCAECQTGRCVDPGQVIYVNYTYPFYNQPTAANITNTTSPTIYHPGGRIFNGLLFGSNEISIPVSGSGYINFTIKNTNRLGSFVVEADNKIILEGNVAADTYTVPFGRSRTIRIYARSSGWFFFAPAVYDVRSISIIYM